MSVRVRETVWSNKQTQRTGDYTMHQGQNETTATTILASAAGTSTYTIGAGRETAITTRIANKVVSNELFIGQF